MYYNHVLYMYCITSILQLGLSRVLYVMHTVHVYLELATLLCCCHRAIPVHMG